MVTEFVPKFLVFPTFFFHFLPPVPSMDQEAVDKSISSNVSYFIREQDSLQKLCVHQWYTQSIYYLVDQ